AGDPRRPRAATPGLRRQDRARPELCGGSAGLYMLSQPSMATRLLDDKRRDVASTDATTVVTANPGCMMQLQRGLVRAGIRGEVKHVVQLLDESYATASQRAGNTPP